MKTLALTSLFASVFFSFSSFANFDVGSDAPAVQLPTLNQGIETVATINSPAVAGQKVVLEFFSTGCSYCIENMKNVREFSKEFADKAIFRLVGIDRQEQLTRDFAASNPDFIVAVDSARVAKKAYLIQETPTTFVIGADNKILYIGLGSWDEVEKTKIRELLSE